MIDPLTLPFLLWATAHHEASGIPEEMRLEDHVRVQMVPGSETEAHLVWCSDGLMLAASFLEAKSPSPLVDK